MTIDFSDWLSIAATLLALASILMTWHFNFRDKPNIKANCRMMDVSAYDPQVAPYIEVKIVNKGRRVAVIHMLGGDTNIGTWSGQYLKDARNGQRGLHLTENAFHIERLKLHDVRDTDPDGEKYEYINLWIEDSHGKRHVVKDSVKHLRELLQACK